MSIKDVIKNSIYESFAGTTGMSYSNIVLILLVACIIGVYIYLIYKYTSKKAFYSKDLNITLAGMAVVVAAIMVAMQANLLVSLGMVGALSIVRFRTAIKNPIDLLYLFWSISAGIICGVGLYVLSVALCMIMTLLIVILQYIPSVKPNAILVLKMDNSADWNAVSDAINSLTKTYQEKSREVNENESEVIIECRTNKHIELVENLSKMTGIISAHYLVHDGEMRV